MSKIPDLHDWVDEFSKEIVRGLSSLPADPELSDKINRLMMQAEERTGGNLLDSMFDYLSAAHGLHGASQVARSLGNTDRADALFQLGQTFLHYVAADIGVFAMQTQSQIPVVHH